MTSIQFYTDYSAADLSAIILDDDNFSSSSFKAEIKIACAACNKCDVETVIFEVAYFSRILSGRRWEVPPRRQSPTCRRFVDKRDSYLRLNRSFLLRLYL